MRPPARGSRWLSTKPERGTEESELAAGTAGEPVAAGAIGVRIFHSDLAGQKDLLASSGGPDSQRTDNSLSGTPSAPIA